MQSIMHHPKCHSFSNTVIMQYISLVMARKKLSRAFIYTVTMSFFLSVMKPDCERSQILVERKTGRQLLPELVQLYVLHSPALLCPLTQLTSNNQIKANKEIGARILLKGFVTDTSKQC